MNTVMKPRLRWRPAALMAGAMLAAAFAVGPAHASEAPAGPAVAQGGVINADSNGVINADDNGVIDSRDNGVINTDENGVINADDNGVIHANGVGVIHRDGIQGTGA
jgi:hypothetical protein